MTEDEVADFKTEMIWMANNFASLPIDQVFKWINDHRALIGMLQSDLPAGGRHPLLRIQDDPAPTAGGTGKEVEDWLHSAESQAWLDKVFSEDPAPVPPEPTPKDSSSEVKISEFTVETEVADDGVNPYLKSLRIPNQQELAEQREMMRDRQERIFTNDSQTVRRIPVRPRYEAGKPSPAPSPGYDDWGARQPID